MEYEEYMRNVLGNNQMPNNIYANTYNDYYYDPYYRNNQPNNMEYLNDMYPEIYKIIYPMICKVCSQNSQRHITKELIDEMANEIYRNIEDTEAQTQNNTATMQRTQLKNGDVRNPNARETAEANIANQRDNYLVRNLIKVLIIRELQRLNRNTFPRQQFPMYEQRGSWRPY